MDSDLDGISNTISKTLEPITNYSPEQKVDEHFHDKQEEDATDRLSKQESDEEFNVNLSNSSQEKHFNNPGIQKSKSLEELKHEDIQEDPILHVKQDKGDDKDKPTDNFNSHESHQSKSLANLKNEEDIKEDLIQFSDEESNQCEPSILLKSEDIYMTYLMQLELLEENSNTTTEDEITTDFMSNLESLETKSLTIEEEDLYINEDLLQTDFNPLVTIDEVEDSHEIKSSTHSKIEETENKEDTKQENLDIKNENKEGCSQENKSSTPPKIEEIEHYEDLLQLDLKHDIKQANVDTKNENEEETHENTSSTDPKIEEIENKEDLMQLGFKQDLKEENAEKENHENKSSTDLKQDSDESDDALCSKISSAQDLHTCRIDSENRPIPNEETAEQSSSTKYKSQQRSFKNVIHTQKDLCEAKRARMMRTFEIKMQLMDLKKQFLIQKLKYAKEEQELKMMLDAALRKKVEAEKELAQRKKE